MEWFAASYRPVFSAAAGAGAQHIGLFLTTRGQTGALRADNAAMMLATRQYLLADFSYEVTMGHRLADAGRSVSKPVRYEAGKAEFPSS